jgi:hypothetical protein
MKKFWIIDGSGEEYETKEKAMDAAKRRAAYLSKMPSPFNVLYSDLNGGNVEDVYVYEAVAIARTPTPNIEVEEIT